METKDGNSVDESMDVHEFLNNKPKSLASECGFRVRFQTKQDAEVMVKEVVNEVFFIFTTNNIL